MGKGHHHGEDEDDPPRHAGIHHRLEPEQRLAVDLEETHHGYEEHTDARVPDGLEEAGDAGRGGQDVGQKQQDDQREQEPQHDFLDFIQPQRTFRVQSFRIQRDQFLHVGLEHVLGHDDEQQGAQRAACYRNDHVLRVIDGHAGHVFIRAEYGKRNLLERDDRHADLRRVHDAENHHRRIAFALLVAALVTDAVQDAPADNDRRGCAGQCPQQHDGQEKRIGEQPRLPRDAFAGDEPQRDEFGQAVIVDGRAEDENEEHHHNERIAETCLEQLVGLHAADEHERQQARHARPDDVYENPAVQHAEKDADQIHPQRGQRGYGRELAAAEHDQEAYQGVGVVGDFFVFARGKKWHDRFSLRGASVTGLFLPVGKKGGGRFPSSCEDGKRRVSKPGGRGGCFRNQTALGGVGQLKLSM